MVWHRPRRRAQRRRQPGMRTRHGTNGNEGGTRNQRRYHRLQVSTVRPEGGACGWRSHGHGLYQQSASVVWETVKATRVTTNARRPHGRVAGIPPPWTNVQRPPVKHYAFEKWRRLRSLKTMRPATVVPAQVTSRHSVYASRLVHRHRNATRAPSGKRNWGTAGSGEAGVCRAAGVPALARNWDTSGRHVVVATAGGALVRTAVVPRSGGQPRARRPPARPRVQLLQLPAIRMATISTTSVFNGRRTCHCSPTVMSCVRMPHVRVVVMGEVARIAHEWYNWRDVHTIVLHTNI